MLITFGVALFCPIIVAGQTDSLWSQLSDAMENKEHYVAIKEQNIEKIRQILSIDNLLPRQEYDINKKMYAEFKKYRADSAIVYVLKNREIALQLNDPLTIESSIRQLTKGH